MGTRKMTNMLLALVFFVLVAMLFVKFPVKEVSADTLRLDSCITTSAYDKPASYLHVVIHDVSPIQSASELEK